MGLAQLREILRHVAHPEFTYQPLYEDGNYFLRVVCQGADNTTGQPFKWHGRKWRLSAHMTDGEVVQTAFLATLTAIEHETRERFTFLGQAVFDPHYDIYALVKLHKSAAAIKRRRSAADGATCASTTDGDDASGNSTK